MLLDFCNLIVIFDDDHYSNSDYDFIDGQHRELIRKVLINNGWTARSSRVFIKDDFELMFPRPSGTLGQDSSDTFIKEIDEKRYIFVTPTQAVLAAMNLGIWDQEAFVKLCRKFPINTEKVRQWKKEYGVDVPTHAELNELYELQKADFLKKIRK